MNSDIQTHLILDELLAPVDNIIMALFVANRNIAGLEPPVQRDSVFSGRNIIKVSLQKVNQHV